MTYLIIFLSFFIFYTLLIILFKFVIKSSTIAIDIDYLTNIDDIITRGILYVNNRDNVILEDYILAHIKEQKLNGKAILKAIKYQNLGYKIVYYTSRHEYLRKATSEFLNQWGLKGALYMNTNKQDGFLCKILILQHLKENMKYLVGLIQDDKMIDDYNKKILKINLL